MAPNSQTASNQGIWIATILLLLATNVGAQPEIHRCVQADGTIAFQEMPCPEPTTTDDPADANAIVDGRPDNDRADPAEDFVDFVNPFDEPEDPSAPIEPERFSSTERKTAPIQSEDAKSARPGPGPRRQAPMKLFPPAIDGLAIAPGAPGAPDNRSDQERVTARLEQWKEQMLAAQQTHSPKTPELGSLEQQMTAWFTPPESAMRQAGLREVPWHESLPKVIFPYFDKQLWQDMADAARQNDRLPLPPRDHRCAYCRVLSSPTSRQCQSAVAGNRHP